MVKLPLNMPAIYCVEVVLLEYGLGPFGFGKEEDPLPLHIHIFLLNTFTDVGYHPVGINPMLLLSPISEISKTARLLLSALAT